MWPNKAHRELIVFIVLGVIGQFLTLQYAITFEHGKLDLGYVFVFGYFGLFSGIVALGAILWAKKDQK